MGEHNIISDVRQALKMSNDIDDTQKLQGIELLRSILAKQDARLTEYGYTEVIFKELIKLAKFESSHLLARIDDLLFEFYSKETEHQDTFMETLIYRYGLSTDVEISLECLKGISSLIDCMSDNIAKHSKQLLQMADIGSPATAKPILVEILEKLKTKLPERKKQA